MIDSVVDLMLSDFITCTVKGDLSSLAQGSPAATEEQLSDAWAKLYSQYIDIIGDSEQMAYLNLSKEAAILETKLTIIHACLNVLTLEFNQEIADQLRYWMPIHEKLDPSDPDQLTKDFESIKMRTVEMRVDLRQLHQELERITPEGTETLDDISFEKIITRLEMHRTYKIDKFTTTTASFAFMVRDYRDSVKTVQYNDTE
jgi:hypothetical protein